jgi:hypothetical protein
MRNPEFQEVTIELLVTPFAPLQYTLCVASRIRFRVTLAPTLEGGSLSSTRTIASYQQCTIG